MAADYITGFATVADCDLSFTPIYDIQGSGATAAITGTLTTQGIVVGDYEGASPTLRGFYLQDLTGDSDAVTSDGIFVYNASNDSVNLGDIVRVTGSAEEYQRHLREAGLQIGSPAWFSASQNLVLAGGELNTFSRRLQQTQAENEEVRRQYKEL